MKINVVNMQGEKVKSIELPKKIFEAPINISLMHQAFVRQMANARLGTHDTKGRSEVSGGGQKPWRQKGTGRARQGSRRAAQFVGGGGIHTPKPRSYELQMPKKMRRAALRSALSVKASEKGIVVVEELNVAEPKTSIMTKSLSVLVGEASTLILIPKNSPEYEMVIRSTNNLPDAKILAANYLNIRDLFKYEKLIFPLKALDVIESYLG